jgi:hypothetical protein
MYFWSLDLIQPRVAIKLNTLSHNTMRKWFDKLCILAKKIINKENPTRMMGGGVFRPSRRE